MTTYGSKEEGIDYKPVAYTEDEKQYRSNLIRGMQNARDQRDAPHPEFDDMSYLEKYDTNKRAHMSYIRKRLNKDDYRITTGVTREKDNTILSSLLELQLENDVFAYDENSVADVTLGRSFEGMIDQSRKMEIYSKVRPLIYQEMVVQGDVFVEEVWKEEFTPQVNIMSDGWTPQKDIASFKVNEEIKKSYEGPGVRMLEGKKVFLGDIRTEFLQDQPYIFTYEIMHRKQAEGVYGTWSRWENVPHGVDNTVMTEFGDGPVYKDLAWNLYQTQKDQVGVLKYYCKQTNRFMIMLNGIMMLPINYPLTAISPSGEYPLSQGKYEPIPNFAYSKGVPDKTKVDQALLDEILKLMIIKNRQSTRPTLGNKSKKVLSKNITMPGKIINDIDEGDVFPILDFRGISNSDFSFYQAVRQMIDEKSVNTLFQGQTPQGNPTATEISETMKQQMMKLGLAIDAVLNLERDMAYLRLYNLLYNYTKPKGTKIKKDKDGKTREVNEYRSMSADAQLEEGQDGKRIYQFTETFPELSEQLAQEDSMQKQMGGKPVRYTYINPKLLNTIKRVWYIEPNPSQRKSDRLSQLMLLEQIGRAAEVFGPQSLNYQKLKQRFAQTFGVEYEDFFVEQSVEDLMASLETEVPAPTEKKAKTPLADNAEKASAALNEYST